MRQAVQMITAFEDSQRRGATQDQLQWFVDRARRHWNGNAEMLSAVETLQLKVRELA